MKITYFSARRYKMLHGKTYMYSVDESTITRHRKESYTREQKWYFENERAALIKGNDEGWPVAEILSLEADNFTVRKYAHTAEEVPFGLTAIQWGKIVTNFYRSLPFRHGAPDAKNIVYDNINEVLAAVTVGRADIGLRVINLDFARALHGEPFYESDEEVGEEWEYATARTLGYDIGYLWLSWLPHEPRMNNREIDQYTNDAAHTRYGSPVAEIAWRERNFAIA